MRQGCSQVCRKRRTAALSPAAGALDGSTAAAHTGCQARGVARAGAASSAAAVGVGARRSAAKS